MRAHPCASVTFTVAENSLVVFIGLASSQQSIGLGGITGFQIDALESESAALEGMIIAHAYLLPGNYTLTEQSAALASGQNPNNMADLIRAFVFGSKSAMILTNLNPSAAAAGGPDFTLTVNGSGFVPGATIFAPGDQLTVTFTAAPNVADLLLFFNNDILTSTGSPVFTTSLYDGQSLLGTYTSVFNGLSFASVFGRPGGGLGADPQL